MRDFRLRCLSGNFISLHATNAYLLLWRYDGKSLKRTCYQPGWHTQPLMEDSEAERQSLGCKKQPELVVAVVLSCMAHAVMELNVNPQNRPDRTTHRDHIYSVGQQSNLIPFQRFVVVVVMIQPESVYIQGGNERFHQVLTVLKGPWTSKLTYIYFIHFPKVHNFLIILTVISVPTILSIQRNLHLKFMIYKNDVKNVPPCHQPSPSTSRMLQA